MNALALAERWGLPVFPCRPANKAPYVKHGHGFKDASRTPDQIASWWTQWPDALVGVPTGHVTGILVIDIDPDGARWYAERSADFVGARIHRTQKGHHLLYRMPGVDIRCSQDELAEGVDVRANGGYIIWWPAAGHEVFGPELDELRDPPAWLLELLRPARSNGHDLAPLPPTSPEAWARDKPHVVAALPYVDAGNRDTWIKAGLAIHLKSGGSEDGFNVWHQWSERGAGYAGIEDCLYHWNSFRHDKERTKTATLGSIFKAAKERGYEPASPDIPPLEAYDDEERAAIQNEPPLERAPPSNDPLAWVEDYMLTDEEAEQISDPIWVEPGFIVEGHVVAIVAKPNGGKTSIMFWYASKWASEGRDVFYVDADTNPSDAKRKRRLAKEHGLNYITPDLKQGKTMRNVVEQLERLAKSNADLTGQVWCFDTLKKMANVINKDSLKHTMGLMRKLSSRGATLILNAHTNKYQNAEGQYQYEGTGDLESDCDELIYFEPRENEDGSLTVSTRCVKRRADISEFTWDIHADRSVTRRDHYLDVAEEQRRQEQREKDEPVIALIAECLSPGPKKQHEIIKHCGDSHIGNKTVLRVLKSYRVKLWMESRLDKNAKEYRLVPQYGQH